MRERAYERPPPVDEGEAARAARPKPHERLPQLITAAFEERNLDEQRRLTTELIDALIEMRAPGDEEAEARVLVAHLDAKTLKHLVDEQGRRAHREAVETLLSLGFPHALQVSPEDLDQYRIDEDSVGALVLANRERWRYAQGAAVAALVSGSITGLLSQSWLGFGIGVGVIAFFGLVTVLPSTD